MANPVLPTEQLGPRLMDGADVNNIVSYLRGPQSVANSIGGSTGTLTAAQVSQNGSPEIYCLSSGGSTPTFTLPTAAQILANLPDFTVGGSYYLRFINQNSGTMTIALGAGITNPNSSTLTLATNTTRDFIVYYAASGALTITGIGTGTMS